MKKLALAALAATALMAAPVSAETVKVGYMTTLSGSAGIIGKQMQNAVNLALEHTGGTLGGKQAEVIFVDDQRKPDVAKQLANRLVKSDRVDVVAGVMVGSFTDLRDNTKAHGQAVDNPFGMTIQGMVEEHIMSRGCAVEWDVPVGHGQRNIPLVLG